MSQTKPRLGRGLDSLLTSSRLQSLQQTQDTDAAPSPSLADSDHIAEIPLDTITRNPHQPRQAWDEDKLGELAESIRANGLVQPIIVRAMGQGYQLVAGERRLRATQMAGQHTITAIVRTVTEQQMLEWALIENIHRTDLNPVERARAYQQYISRFSLSQEQAAERLGDDRSTIANYLRLLDLSQPILNLLTAGSLTMGHARALLGLPEAHRREELAHETLKEKWSVRELERRIQNIRNQQPRTPPEPDPHIVELEQELTRTVGTKVSIKTAGRKRHRGKIIIDFYSLDDFDRIRERLQEQERGERNTGELN